MKLLDVGPHGCVEYSALHYITNTHTHNLTTQCKGEGLYWDIWKEVKTFISGKTCTVGILIIQWITPLFSDNYLY